MAVAGHNPIFNLLGTVGKVPIWTLGDFQQKVCRYGLLPGRFGLKRW